MMDGVLARGKGESAAASVVTPTVIDELKRLRGENAEPRSTAEVFAGGCREYMPSDAMRGVRFCFYRSFILSPSHEVSGMSVGLTVRALAAAFAVAVCSPALLLPLAPSAAAATCGTRSNYFDGFTHNNASGQRFEGSSTYLVVRASSLCSTDTNYISNFSNSWSMIAGGSGCQWAQSGFETGYGQPIKHFAQIAGSCSNIVTVYGAAIHSGEKHAYRSLYNATCRCVKSTVDTTTFIVSNFDPYGTWTYPFQPQFEGETAYLASDMPGVPTSQTAFSAIGAQRVSDDVLISMPCTMVSNNSNPAAWALSASSCTAFNIWSK